MWPFTKQKPKVQHITLILNRYQVQIYNNNSELIHTVISEGFTPLAALDKSRQELLLLPKSKLIYPLKFFTTTKN